MSKSDPTPNPASDTAVPPSSIPAEAAPDPAKETGGPKETDPTRYGDWTVKGRCIDF